MKARISGSIDRSIHIVGVSMAASTVLHVQPTRTWVFLQGSILRPSSFANQKRQLCCERNWHPLRYVAALGGLTDHEIEGIMQSAADAGAQCAHYSVLHLSHELKDLFKQWLAAERPERAERVMSLIRQMRGGKENDARFGLRMVGEGPVADALIDRFRLARRRFGLDRKPKSLRTDLFRVPPNSEDQLALF